MSAKTANPQTEIAKYRRELDDERKARKALEEKVAGIQQEAKNAERYARLVGLERQGYELRSGKVGDNELQGADYEFELCKGMSDEQFNTHEQTIVSYARKAEVVPFVVPNSVDGAKEDVAVDRYKLNQEAIALASKYRAEGRKNVTWDACLREVTEAATKTA